MDEFIKLFGFFGSIALLASLYYAIEQLTAQMPHSSAKSRFSKIWSGFSLKF